MQDMPNTGSGEPKYYLRHHLNATERDSPTLLFSKEDAALSRAYRYDGELQFRIEELYTAPPPPAAGSYSQAWTLIQQIPNIPDGVYAQIKRALASAASVPSVGSPVTASTNLVEGVVRGAREPRGLTTLLQAAGAMRLVRCHDGSGEAFEAYDKDIADRVVADLRAKIHAYEERQGGTAAPTSTVTEAGTDDLAIQFVEVLQTQFEQDATYHGNAELARAKNDTCENGWFPATYHDRATELAWRVYANREFARRFAGAAARQMGTGCGYPTTALTGEST